MKIQSCLLSAAIVSALALSAAPADAANNNRVRAAGTTATRLPIMATRPDRSKLDRSSGIIRAQGLLNGPAARLVHRASADAFVAKGLSVDAKGTEHARFNRTYHGLPVIGGDFVLHSRNGMVTGVSQTLNTAVRPDVTPRINSQQAIVEAGTRFGTGYSGTPTSRLVIYARGGITPALAHEVILSGVRADQTPTEMHYFVDARTGKVLGQWDAIQTAGRRRGPGRPGGGGNGGGSCTPEIGTGHSLTEGNVTLDTIKCGDFYQLKDMTRGGGSTNNMGSRKVGNGSVFVDADNSWGNNGLNDSATVAADAHYGVSETWDYYLNIHNRQGIDGNGTGALSRVHYGRNYGNAFWNDNCYCMTFGDGDNGVSIFPLVALDVAGHEMTHGVTSQTAGLNYADESGGLNEATSDMMGTMVEFYANNPNDPADYVVGEKLFPNNADMSKAIRWMFKPSLDGQSPDCYAPGLGDLDVHYSSGVANHFYYLLAEGAVVPAGFGAGTWANLATSDMVCDSSIGLTGIGRAKAEQIWYVALTEYMTSGTNYADAREATLNAAADLYGPGAEVNAVNAAWDAVSVPAAPPPALRRR